MRKLFLFLLVSNSLVFLQADEVFLRNDDRLSGTLLEETDQMVIISTEALGTVSLERKYVKKIVKDKKLKGEIVAGVSLSRGNTETTDSEISAKVTYAFDHTEISAKGKAYYSASDGVMSDQKWNVQGRFTKNIPDSKWYLFGNFESDHDKFADIDYRLLPSLGAGYKLIDRGDLKLSAEIAPGYEYTVYSSDLPDDKETVLVGRVHFEKKFFGESMVSQDFTIYPELEDFGEFRMLSETAITSPLNNMFSLRLSLIDEYNSDPPDDTKKNDLRIQAAVVYTL